MAGPTAALHPWNEGFEWVSPRGPRRILDEPQRRHFDERGFVVLEGVFEPGDIDPLIADFDAIEVHTESFLQGQKDGRLSIAESGAITFTPHVVLRSEAARRFAGHRVFAELCHDLVGPDVNLYWDQVVYKKPEKPRRFPWHQDNGYTFIEPQHYLTCWVALTDATEENGCPWVAPAYHRLGTLQHRYVDPLGWECFAAPESPVAAPVGAGGIVVFSSLTPHLTGPNTTGSVRKAYILQYAPAGSQMLLGRPEQGGATGRVSVDDPQRQFAVLRHGEPVPPPAAG